MSTPEQLRDLADRIAGFPKFIRRDAGSKSVRDTLAEILVEHGAALDPDLLDDLEQFTEELRLTVGRYYRNQFL